MDGMWFTPLLDQFWPAKYGCDSFSLSKLEIKLKNCKFDFCFLGCKHCQTFKTLKKLLKKKLKKKKKN
jgi:hypothetical protein